MVLLKGFQSAEYPSDRAASSTQYVRDAVVRPGGRWEYYHTHVGGEQPSYSKSYIQRNRLTEFISIQDIIPNKFNSRLNYSKYSVEKMARSISRNGLLTPITVRRCLNNSNKFELVYGHRRLAAARKLGLNVIRAEIVETSDEQMIIHSLIENCEREDLSDYEKALVFERLSKEFGRTYDEIGEITGLSKQQVGGYLAMLRLFDAETLSEQPELKECLVRISEHHARILSRVTETSNRASLAKMIVRDNLSVRETARIVTRLRGLFAEKNFDERAKVSAIRGQDLKEIREIVMRDFVGYGEADFSQYERTHLYHQGFDMFPSYPAAECFEEDKALDQEKKWFYEILPKLKSEVRNLKIKKLGLAAVATFIVHYSGTYMGRRFDRNVRGTMVLIKKDLQWKIVHEHWSRLEGASKSGKMQRPQTSFSIIHPH